MKLLCGLVQGISTMQRGDPSEDGCFQFGIQSSLQGQLGLGNGSDAGFALRNLVYGACNCNNDWLHASRYGLGAPFEKHQKSFLGCSWSGPSAGSLLRPRGMIAAIARLYGFRLIDFTFTVGLSKSKVLSAWRSRLHRSRII